MVLSISSIAYVSLLLINSIAVLSHDRFLVPLGLHSSAHTVGGGGGAGGGYGNGFENYGGPQGQEGPGVKQRAVALVGAVRTLMRIPLIPINIVVIIYEILLG